MLRRFRQFGSPIPAAATSRAGFTLAEIMIVVLILALIVAITIPNMLRARNNAQQKACIGNLKEIDNAVQQWAIETKKAGTTAVTNAKVTPYLRTGRMPVCPASGTYKVTTVSAKPTCSKSASGHSL
jgi:prepilin-type N-terminal cleavage/methylation domain-containing protein